MRTLVDQDRILQHIFRIHMEPERAKEKIKAHHRYFCWARNPFDRTVSLAAYSMGYRPAHSQHQMTVDEFEEWVLEPRVGWREWYTAPQAAWLTLLPTRPAYLGRFEHIARDFQQFMRVAFNVTVDGLPQINESNRGPMHLYYQNERVVQAVLDWCREDFTLLGYHRDPCQASLTL
jgi:hypothetical protein